MKTTLPWIALGVGGAGLVAGGVTGAMALDRRKKLDDGGSCFDGHCASWMQTDVDRYNQLRTLSTVGFVVGGVGVAAGAALLFLLPSKAPPPPSAGVRPWVGVGSAGVEGAF